MPHPLARFGLKRNFRSESGNMWWHMLTPHTIENISACSCRVWICQKKHSYRKEKERIQLRYLGISVEPNHQFLFGRESTFGPREAQVQQSPFFNECPRVVILVRWWWWWWWWWGGGGGGWWWWSWWWWWWNSPISLDLDLLSKKLGTFLTYEFAPLFNCILAHPMHANLDLIYVHIHSKWDASKKRCKPVWKPTFVHKTDASLRPSSA